MPTEIRSTDKAPLQAFVGSVVNQLASAADSFEQTHESWYVGNIDLVIRGALRPVTDGKGVMTIYLDIDEPTKIPISEIPVPLKRRWKPSDSL